MIREPYPSSSNHCDPCELGAIGEEIQAQILLSGQVLDERGRIELDSIQAGSVIANLQNLRAAKQRLERMQNLQKAPALSAESAYVACAVRIAAGDCPSLQVIQTLRQGVHVVPRPDPNQ